MQIQAAFAKQVAQAIDADGPSRASVETPIALETPAVISEPPSEQFNPQPVVAPAMFGIKLTAATKFDVESSNLQVSFWFYRCLYEISHSFVFLCT